MYNSDTKKEYSEGKVILSTTEYRDLIEKNAELNNDYCKLRHENWQIEREKQELEKNVSKLTEKNQNYENFLEQNKLKESFAAYIAMKKMQEDKEIEE